MKTNLISKLINHLFWSLGLGYDYRKDIYIRDRKGRFAKEPQVIKFYPIKRNFYNE